MAWAHGLVIETRTGALLGGTTLRMANTVTVRDEGSLQTAKRIGVLQAKKTADPAILFQPDNAVVGKKLLQEAGIPDGKPLIALTPTFWQHYHRSRDLVPYAIARKWGFRKNRGIHEIEKLITSLAAVCDLLASRRGADIILLPRYASAPWPDIGYLHDIRSKTHDPASVTVYEKDLPPTTYFAMWHHVDAVLSVALHDAVVAAALEKPTVQIVYEEKGANFARAIGSEDLTLTLASFVSKEGPEHAATLIGQAIDTWQSRIETHRKKVGVLQEAARSNADELLFLLPQK